MSDEKREPLASPAQSETPGMLENSMRENRETPPASGSHTPDRLEKATSYKTRMYASGESDSAVVPAKCPNKGELCRAEGMEGRVLAKKNQRSRSHAPDTAPCKACPRVRSGCAKRRGQRLTPSFKARAVCTKVCPYGSVRGAESNLRPYRD